VAVDAVGSSAGAELLEGAGAGSSAASGSLLPHAA
jgi:hypothetical protein